MLKYSLTDYQDMLAGYQSGKKSIFQPSAGRSEAYKFGFKCGSPFKDKYQRFMANDLVGKEYHITDFNKYQEKVAA